MDGRCRTMFAVFQNGVQRVGLKWLGVGLASTGVVVFLLFSSCNHVTDTFTYEAQEVGTIRAKLDGQLFSLIQTRDVNWVAATADALRLTGIEGEILGLSADGGLSLELDRYSFEQDAYGLQMKETNKAPVWVFPGAASSELPAGVLRLAHITPSDEVELTLPGEAPQPVQPSAGAVAHLYLQPPESTAIRFDVAAPSELELRTSGQASVYLAVEGEESSDMKFEMSTRSGVLALFDPLPSSLRVNGADILPMTSLSAVIIVSTVGSEIPSPEFHGVVGLSKDVMLVCIASDTDVRSIQGVPPSEHVSLGEGASPALAIAAVAEEVWISRQAGNLVVRDRSYSVTSPSTIEIRGIDTSIAACGPSAIAFPEDVGTRPDEVLPLEFLATPGLAPESANLVLPLVGRSQVGLTGRSSRILLNGHNISSTSLDTYPDWLQPLLIALVAAAFATAVATDWRRLASNMRGR